MRRLTGRWGIVQMDMWDRDAIDLVEPGFIEFAGDGTGQLGFIAVRGWMDCRTTERDGRTTVEFSWDGDDEGTRSAGAAGPFRWATQHSRDTYSSIGETTPASGRNPLTAPIGWMGDE
ncbi:hypothetical protein [Rhodococcus jostii]|uniref:Uncharacterized protein n=1 Tax=Rhodococcus jostii TaxID=132919 RepID=A0A1H4TKH4_RHOJO|nr:hypothetical protein [Rhodococcus jostii]SEC56952.1 hypothetical protein SAMN04490220_1978 [Rhodococcus jostii]